MILLTFNDNAVAVGGVSVFEVGRAGQLLQDGLAQGCFYSRLNRVGRVGRLVQVIVVLLGRQCLFEGRLQGGLSGSYFDSRVTDRDRRGTCVERRSGWLAVGSHVEVNFSFAADHPATDVVSDAGFMRWLLRLHVRKQLISAFLLAQTAERGAALFDQVCVRVIFVSVLVRCLNLVAELLQSQVHVEMLLLRCCCLVLATLNRCWIAQESRRKTVSLEPLDSISLAKCFLLAPGQQLTRHLLFDSTDHFFALPYTLLDLLGSLVAVCCELLLICRNPRVTTRSGFQVLPRARRVALFARA